MAVALGVASVAGQAFFLEDFKVPDFEKKNLEGQFLLSPEGSLKSHLCSISDPFLLLFLVHWLLVAFFHTLRGTPLSRSSGALSL